MFLKCYLFILISFLMLQYPFKLKGIDAFPISEDLMEWEAIIEGLQDSMWQGLWQPILKVCITSTVYFPYFFIISLY